MAFLVTACGPSGDGPGDEGPFGQACAEPATECPAAGESPVLGGPCAPGLECSFDDDDDFEFLYRCEAEQWVVGGGCREDDDEICARPPLAERCADPFDGTLEGATLRVGPGDVSVPFRSFRDGEEPDLVVGPQGGTMVAVRIEVVGVDVPPCLLLHTVARRGDRTLEADQPFAMHCDRSNPLYLVVPLTCDGETPPLDLELEVAGVGTAEVRLAMPPDDCP